MIKKSKTKEDKPDFEDMMSEVDGELEANQVEQDIVDRVPELKELSNSIDNATNTWINATLQLESAVRLYYAAQNALDNAVGTISDKVDIINTHIDNVLKDAPTKLNVSVRVADEDWKTIQEMFRKERQWMTSQMQEHIRYVNEMFVDEHRRAQNRYKEYDGTYLGHYIQYFFWFFCVLGIVIVGLVIFLSLDSYYHWTK